MILSYSAKIYFQPCKIFNIFCLEISRCIVIWFEFTLNILGLKIHISDATKTILEMLGGFVIEERGEVYLKVIYQNQWYFFLNAIL